MFKSKNRCDVYDFKKYAPWAGLLTSLFLEMFLHREVSVAWGWEAGFAQA